MKTAILMRHAKSSWKSLDLDDHARPLNRRGREAAPVMARWLEAQGLLPDRLIGSTAQRVRETIALMRAAVPALPEPKFTDALFHAGPGVLEGHLRALPPDCACGMLVAHEPGLSSYLAALDPPGTPARCRRAYEHYPTAAIAVLSAEVEHWAEWGAGAVRFTEFAVPREIEPRDAG